MYIMNSYRVRGYISCAGILADDIIKPINMRERSRKSKSRYKAVFRDHVVFVLGEKHRRICE